MSAARPPVKLGQRVLAFVAIAFGLATVFAGVTVLAGADPGYAVFRPLLIFNTTMGVAYVAAGLITLRSLARGRLASAAIFVLNLLVLAIIGYLFTTGGAVAVDSVRAMTFRSAVWLVLFLGLTWLGRGSHAPRR
jgi:hypothetical protein